MATALTRSGRRLLLGAGGTTVLGRAFGLEEVVVLGACGLALVVCTWLLTRFRRPRLQLDRQLQPAVTSVGEVARVRLEVSNPGRWPSPPVEVIDPLRRRGEPGPAPQAQVLLAPLPRGASVSRDYELATPRRGVIELGPLRVVHGDPFGLTTAHTTQASVAHLVTLPHVDAIAPPRGDQGGDRTDGVARRRTPTSGGDELASLRDYVPGDDLRKVHWATTARRGSMMVRQDERPWHARTTIVLDVGASGYDVDAFEMAVSATASIAGAATRRGDEVRVVTTGGVDSLAGSGPRHLANVLRTLALVTPEADGSLVAVLGSLRGHIGEGTLVIVGSDAAAGRLDAVEHIGARSTVVVVVPPSGVVPADLDGDGDGAPVDGGPSGTRWNGRGRVTVTVDARGFPAAWRDVMGIAPATPVGANR